MSNLPAIVERRGIPPEVWSALKNSIFPGAADESVAMAWDYCAARQVDVMLKPVHLVPMSVKDAKTGESIYRDVVMPGIGLYRIQADRAGNYAGMTAPIFGPDITHTFSSTYEDKFTKKPVTQQVTVTFPEWCEITVQKLIGERIVSFTAREYWIENYATTSGKSEVPNAMWKKRPRGQLAKCAEAQALRKAWPEIGSQPTAEEMEGKEIEVGPIANKTPEPEQPKELPFYPQEQFNKNLPSWEKLITTGKKTAKAVVDSIQSRAQLTPDQIATIETIYAPIEGQAEEVTDDNA